MRSEVIDVMMVFLLAVIAVSSVVTALCAVSSELRTQQFLSRMAENMRDR